MPVEIVKDKELAAYGIFWDYWKCTWVFPFASDICTIRVCRFMQLSLAINAIARLPQYQVRS